MLVLGFSVRFRDSGRVSLGLGLSFNGLSRLNLLNIVDWRGLMFHRNVAVSHILRFRLTEINLDHEFIIVLVLSGGAK